MAIIINATAVIQLFWTDFETTANNKPLQIQYDDDGITYSIYSFDGPQVFTCTIWKGTVPDGVTLTYSQSQNDTDKSDFETNYKPTANKRIDPSTSIANSTYEKATYVAETALAGANNKDMISILNPSASGKIVKIREVWAAVPNSSGTTVIIPFEMRRASAITTGTTVTAGKFDNNDSDSVAVVRTAPTGITDVSLLYTWIEQINSAQGSTNAHSHIVQDAYISETRPIVLRETEGLYLKQVANNTSTFRMGILWTEA